jgi:hypothetical protein
VIVREAKTTGDDIRGFGDYWQRLQVDAQVNFYYLAFGAETLFYDVAYRPQIKCCGKDEKAAKARLKREPTPQEVIDSYQGRLEGMIDEEPDRFFQWRPVHKTDQDLVKARFDLYQQAQMLKAAWRFNRWPRNSSACLSRFGRCKLLDVCTGRADIADDALFQITDHARKRQLPVVA